MLKHGRAGVPMEVMGLMLGEFVDDYTVRVIDVFAMPQSGTVNCGHLILNRNRSFLTNTRLKQSYL
jgi:proteasome lid subunit RPN8/RPN11